MVNMTEAVEVVIRIPCSELEYAKKGYTKAKADVVYRAIENGTVLPEGHGRLIDADKYKFDNEDAFCIGFGDDAMNVFKRSVDNTQTVIEADKESDINGKDID